MAFKIIQSAVNAGARMGSLSLSRRGLLRFAGNYVAVPFALDHLVTVVTAGKLNEEVQDYSVLAATLAIAYGPLRTVRMAKAALAVPASAMMAARGAPIAFRAYSRLSYSRISAFVSQISISPISIANGVKSFSISIGNYGSMVVSQNKGKVTIAGTTAAVTALIAGGHLIATSKDLSIEEIASSALQIAVGAATHLQQSEIDELSEALFKHDPINLLSSLSLMADAAVRENSFVSRQLYSKLALESISTEVQVSSNMYFDMFIDSDGDEILSIDGTYFKVTKPSGMSNVTDLFPVHPADRTNESPTSTLSAVYYAAVDMMANFRTMGDIPFVKGDGDELLSPPHAFKINGEDLVMCLAFSEDGALFVKLFGGGFFSSVDSSYDAVATRNWLESALDVGEEGLEAASAALSNFSDFLSSLNPFADAASDKDQEETAVIETGNRLASKPGEISVFTYHELESIL